MISKFFNNTSSGGGTPPPGTYTPGSVLFGAADGSIGEDNPRFFWDDTNDRLGLGVNTALSARMQIRGVGNTNATSSFLVQNSSSSDTFRILDSRQWVAGGGSAVANTIYTFNAHGSATESDFIMQVVGSSGDNTFRMSNAEGFTNGGGVFRRSTTTKMLALSIRGGTTISMRMSSGGGLFFSPIQTLAQIANDSADFGGNFISGSNDATYPGLIYSVDATRSYGHSFVGFSRQTQNSNFPFFAILPQYSLTENLGITYNATMMKLYPSYNFVGTSITNVTAFEYNPTVTALNGSHYGIVFRPSTLNGIGLGLSNPTSLWHLAGSTTTRSSLRIENGVLPTGANHKDGDFTYDGTDINFRQNATTKKLEYQPINQTVNATTATTTVDFALGNVVLINLQVATTALTLTNLKVGTFIIIVKQDATGGRLMTYTTTMNFAGGVSPVLTPTINRSDIFTIVYDGTNVRTAVSQNYTV